MDALPQFNHNNIEPSILNELIPRQIRLNAQNFKKLLEDYYTFLNLEKNPSYVIQRIIDEHDLDKVIDDLYLDKIKNEIAKAIPTSPYVQKTFLLKRIIDSYGIRGNEESVLYFFRVFFNEEVSVYNPWERVIFPSQGKWNQHLTCRAVLYIGDENVLSNNTIVQYDNRNRPVASIDVSNAKKRFFNNKIYFDLELRSDTISGVFFEEYPIQTIDGKARGKLVRILDSLKIIDPGSGYEEGNKIYLGGLENISFSAIVDKVDPDTGGILSTRLYNLGTSSSIQYFDDIANDLTIITNLSTVYLQGVITIDESNNIKLTTNALIGNPEFKLIQPEFSYFNLANYNNRLVDIVGLVTSEGIVVNSIYTSGDVNIVLYDFKYYNTNIQEPPKNGDSFQSFDNLVIKSSKVYDSNTQAQFQLSFSPMRLSDGFYENEKGRPSGFSVLQDSFYYQVFSYEINTTFPVTQWKAELEDLIHPAGFKVFGRINSLSEGTLEGNAEGIIEIDPTYTPPNINVGPEDDEEKFKLISYVSAQSQDYNFDDVNIYTSQFLTASPNGQYQNLYYYPNLTLDLMSTNIELHGPYFSEDYISSLSFDYNLMYDGDMIVFNGAQLVFSISTGIQFGLATQGENQQEQLLGNETSAPINLDGTVFNNGYTRRKLDSSIWTKQ